MVPHENSIQAFIGAPPRVKDVSTVPSSTLVLDKCELMVGNEFSYFGIGCLAKRSCPTPLQGWMVQGRAVNMVGERTPFCLGSTEDSPTRHSWYSPWMAVSVRDLWLQPTDLKKGVPGMIRVSSGKEVKGKNWVISEVPQRRNKDDFFRAPRWV